MKKAKTQSERGFALIAVLCLVMTVSILVASMVAMSQYSAIETDTFTNYSLSYYIAESSANRIRWLLLADRKLFPGRKIGSIDYKNLESERFMADAVIHKLKTGGKDVKFSIVDALCGIDVSGRVSSRSISLLGNLKFADDEKQLDEFKAFCNRLEDYTDSDSFVRQNSMEKNEYELEKMYALPRNRQLQFREEMLYIQGFSKYLGPDKTGRLSSIRLIAPQRMRPLRGRGSLYGSSVSFIADSCKLTDQEKKELADAMNQWRQNRTLLSESLTPELLGKVSVNFSTNESGIYTILVNTASKDSAGVRLAVTFRPAGGTPISEYYEYLIY